MLGGLFLPKFREIAERHPNLKLLIDHCGLNRQGQDFHRVSDYIDATRPDLVINTGLAREAEQFEWLASQLSRTGGKPLALFLHKPLFLNAPDDAELAATWFRYVPMPARTHLIEMLRSVDCRLVASGHVHQRRDFSYSHTRQIWAPSTGFIIADAKQEVIGTKEVGLVEYRFQPDSFEVRHVRAPGQIDIDLDSLWDTAAQN
jgi:hypothetical protein